MYPFNRIALSHQDWKEDEETPVSWGKRKLLTKTSMEELRKEITDFRQVFALKLVFFYGVPVKDKKLAFSLCNYDLFILGLPFVVLCLVF